MAGSGTLRSALLGWATLIACGLALAAVALPGSSYLQALTEDGVHLDGGPVEVSLPADTRYGIYVNDADNSGYSVGCTAVDDRGNPRRMEFPPWNISSSDTEVLDLAFNTGTGRLTVSCNVPGAEVSLRPVPNIRALLLGLALAGLLACLAVALFAAWFPLGRRGRQDLPAAVS